MKLIISLFCCFWAASGAVYAQDAQPTNISQAGWLYHTGQITELYTYIESAETFGLDKNKYDHSFIRALTAGEVPLLNSTDSLAADITLSAAAIHFFNDVANGRKPEMAYSGLRYTADCQDIAGLLNNAVADGTLKNLLEKIEPRDPGYVALKKKLQDTRSELADTIYTSAYVTPKMIKDAKRPSKTTLQNRVNDLKRSLNTVRWLNCLLQKSENTIIVNIPSATLLVYEKDSIIFESKVVVGKRTTRTPVFTSQFTDITLYPYWWVPHSIATKELLPHIKRNFGYLEANNLQVVTSYGRVVNPYSINWHSLSANNFPYTLRQSTGCDNSLGIIRLNISNPFNVYLHDTPAKGLFSSSSRYFSHGCIRVEKALDLARLLLKENRIAVDTLDEKGCLPHQPPKIIPVVHKTPVLVLYNTAWYDMSGVVRFYPDIYNRISRQ